MMILKMMKSSILAVCLGLLLLGQSFLSFSSHADEGEGAGQSSEPNQCVVPRVKDGKVPFPLTDANTKFDLAVNETYLLKGKIITRSGDYFLQLDFKAQPWLGTKKRLKRSFIMIDRDSVVMVKDLVGQTVELPVIVVYRGGEDVVLAPIVPPVQ